MSKNYKKIETDAIENYTLNMQYLQQTNKYLYEQITVMSELINNQKYQEKFALEYIEKQKEFDLIYLETNQSLYNKNPKNYNKKAVQQLGFDTKSTINALSKKIYIQKDIPLNISNFDAFEQETYNKVLNNLKDFKLIFETSIYDKEQTIHKVYKFIAFGTLLGKHLPLIYKKLKMQNFLIIEPNLEIFRLSLFVTPYYKLAKQTNLIFSIMEDGYIFNNTLDKFYNSMVFNNDYIKFYSTNINTETVIEKTLSLIANYDPINQPYERKMTFLERVITLKKEQYNFLDINTITSPLFKKPILFLAAGPSLSQYYSWVKENQNRFIIIAPVSLFQILLQNEITSDIVTIADYSHVQMNNFNSNTKNKLRHTIVLANSSLDPQILSNFNKEYIFFVSSNSSFLKQQKIPATNVGDFTLYLLLKLQIPTIFLLGLDLSYSKNKKGYVDSYTDIHEDLNEEYINPIQAEKSSLIKDYSLYKNTLKVKGNFREYVDSQSIWYQSIQCCNNFILDYKTSNTKIFNLSDGAYLQESIPQAIDDLDCSQFDVLNKEDLYNRFKHFSYKKMQEKELQKLYHEKEFIKQIKLQLDNLFFKEISTWEKSRNQLFNLLLNDSRKDFLAIRDIFLNYFMITETYLNSQLNNTKNKNLNLHPLSKLWQQKLSILLQRYLDILNQLGDNG